MIVYRMDMLPALKLNGYNTGRIMREKLFGQSDVQKLRDNIVLGIVGIDKLCKYLETQPGNIIRYIPDDDYERMKAAGVLEPYEIPKERNK